LIFPIVFVFNPFNLVTALLSWACLGAETCNATCNGIHHRSYCSFAYSAFAAMRMGMSGSASFQEREEILICRLGFGGVTLQGISACETEMGECSGEMVADKLRPGQGFSGTRRQLRCPHVRLDARFFKLAASYELGDVGAGTLFPVHPPGEANRWTLMRASRLSDVQVSRLITSTELSG